MDKLEMLKQALQELGEAPAQDLAEFIERQFGIKVEAKFIPIWKVSLRGRQALEQSRNAARSAISGPGSDH
jgi:hypothetical protein